MHVRTYVLVKVTTFNLQVMIDAFEKTSIKEVKNFIAIQVAFIVNLYPEITKRLEEIIGTRNDSSDSLLLSYAAQCSRLSDKNKENCINFILNQYHSQRNISNPNGVVHAIHSLGNTKSTITVEHLIGALHSRDVEISKSALYALRHHVEMPIVQAEIAQLLESTFYHKDLTDMTLQILNLKAQQLEQFSDDTIKIGHQLSEALQNSKAFQLQFLENHPELKLQSTHQNRRRKRQVTTDQSDYPAHNSITWNKQIGPDMININLDCEAFVGCRQGEACKMYGKVAAVANVFGTSYTIFSANMLNQRRLSESTSYSQIYAAIGEYVLINVARYGSYEDNSYSSPKLQLFDLEHTIFVLFGFLRFYIQGYAQLTISASLHLYSTSTATATLGPEVTLTIEGGGTQSLLVS